MTSSPWDSSRLATSIVAPCSRSPGELLAHVLAGQLNGGHVRLAHLLDLIGRRGTTPAPAPFHEVLGHAVGPHPHRSHGGRHAHRHESGLDRFGQALAGQVRRPGHTAGGRRAVLDLDGGAEKMEFGRSRVGQVGHPVNDADDPVGPESRGFFEHAAVGRSVALRPRLFDPGLLHVLAPHAGARSTRSRAGTGRSPRRHRRSARPRIRIHPAHVTRDRLRTSPSA